MTNRASDMVAATAVPAEEFDLFALIHSYEQFFAKSHIYWHKKYKSYIGTNRVHALAELSNTPLLSQKELAERLCITPGAVTAMTDDLEKRGLIEKAYSPTDKRTIQLKITGAGQAVLEETIATAKVYVEEICNVLSQEEREALFAINQKLCAHLDCFIKQ